MMGSGGASSEREEQGGCWASERQQQCVEPERFHIQHGELKVYTKEPVTGGSGTMNQLARVLGR